MEWGSGSRLSPDKPHIQVIDEVKEDGEEDVTERKQTLKEVKLMNDV